MDLLIFNLAQSKQFEEVNHSIRRGQAQKVEKLYRRGQGRIIVEEFLRRIGQGYIVEEFYRMRGQGQIVKHFKGGVRGK